MSVMLEDLRDFLLQDTNIATKVSTRCYPQVLPQNPALPALTYSQVSAVRLYELLGEAGKVRLRISISSWATTHIGAHQLADAVRRRLSGFYGWMSDTNVGSVILDNELDLFEEEAGTVGLYRVMQDYIVAQLED